MRDGPDIAGVAALLGDPARANILGALMAGQALTAGELAATAGVTPQTTSVPFPTFVFPSQQALLRTLETKGH